MTRTVRYLSRVVLQTFLTMLGMTALLLLYYAVTTEPAYAERTGGVVTGVVFGVGLIFPLLMQLNTVTYYLTLSLSMSVTRRGCFLGLTAAKVGYALSVAAILVAAQIAVGQIFGTAPVFVGARLVGVMAVMLISACLGSTAGMLGLRYGRTLLLIFSVGPGILCGIVGGIIGFAGATERIDGLLPALLSLFGNMPLLCSIAFAIFLVLTAVDWRICRGISVK